MKKKEDRRRLCETSQGPFRQRTSVPFFPQDAAMHGLSIMRRRSFPIALCLGIALLLAGGCRKQPPGKYTRALTASQYGELPGLVGTTSQALQDELARIVEEGGTPKQLMNEEIPDAENVAAGLEGLFPQMTAKAVRTRSDELFPDQAFTMNPVRLEKAIRFRKKYDMQRLQARAALARPKCDFGICHLSGAAAQMPFINVAWICARLEAFQAAEALFADHDPGAAIDSLGCMFRLAECLAAEKRVIPRIEAAHLRREAFSVMQAILQERELEPEHLERLHGLMQGMLATWPDDANAWIGDRAAGMHCYEIERDGHILALLAPNELAQFNEEGIVDHLPAAAKRIADEDELYYLETMRRIIDGCKGPYLQRKAQLDEIQTDLLKRRDSADYPLVAARLLLVDLEAGQKIQARDRAACEAWTLALALASHGKPPPLGANPLSGREYTITREAGLITIGNVGPRSDPEDSTVVVPDLGGGTKSSP